MRERERTRDGEGGLVRESESGGRGRGRGMDGETVEEDYSTRGVSDAVGAIKGERKRKSELSTSLSLSHSF